LFSSQFNNEISNYSKLCKEFDSKNERLNICTKTEDRSLCGAKAAIGTGG
jgi:hypothetical protein